MKQQQQKHNKNYSFVLRGSDIQYSVRMRMRMCVCVWQTERERGSMHLDSAVNECIHLKLVE
jgi:hypothetical protein